MRVEFLKKHSLGREMRLSVPGDGPHRPAEPQHATHLKQSLPGVPHVKQHKSHHRYVEGGRREPKASDIHHAAGKSCWSSNEHAFGTVYGDNGGRRRGRLDFTEQRANSCASVQYSTTLLQRQTLQQMPTVREQDGSPRLLVYLGVGGVTLRYSVQSPVVVRHAFRPQQSQTQSIVAAEYNPPCQHE